MPKKTPILLTFNAVDNATASIKKINEKFKKQTQAVTILSNKYKRLQKELSGVTKAGKKMGGALKGAGQSLTMGATVPLVAFGASIIKVSANFEKSMNRVKALTGATGKDFNDLKDQAKLLGSTTEYSASQASDAMAFLGQAGFKTKEIMGSLPGILDLATASGTDLARTADIASNIMGAFGTDLTDSNEVKIVMDTLAAATASANVDMEMLSETMAKSAPIAKKYGISLQDTTSAAGLLGNIGIQGSVAGTTLNNMMLRLAAPTSAIKNTLKQLGVSTVDSAGNMRSLTDILGQLGKGMNGLGEGEKLAALNEVFGKRAIAGAGELLTQALKVGSDGKNAIEKYTDSLSGASEGAGKAAEMAEIMRGGASGAMAGIASAFEGLQIAIGESGLLEDFTSLVKSITITIREMSGADKETLKFWAKLGLVLAVLGPILIALGSLISSFMTILPLLTVVGGYIGAAASALWGFLPAILAVGKALFLIVIGALTPLLLFLGKAILIIGAVAAVFYVLGKAVKHIGAYFGYTIKPVEYFVTKLKEAWGWMQKLGKTILGKMGISFETEGEDAIKPAAKNALNETTIQALNKPDSKEVVSHEVTLKDSKGQEIEKIQVARNKKIIRSKMGAVMGA